MTEQERGATEPSTAPSAATVADLVAFKQEFLDQDVCFRGERYTKALAELARLTASGPDVATAEYQLALAAIVRLGDNAHTMLLNTGWLAKFNRLPLRFLICGDGVYIGAADPSHAHLVGSRLESLAGVGWPDLQAVWARYQSGRTGWRDQFIYGFLESPAVLFAAGVAPARDRVTLVLEMPDGGFSRVVVRAHAPDPLPAGIEALIPPSRALLISRAEPSPIEPLYLQSPTTPFRCEYPAKGEIAYIQFRSNKDFDGPLDIAQFAADTEARLRAGRPRFIILDERDNWGGDLTTTRSLVKALPEIVGPQGRVFILTSGRTFSAGIASAAYAKQAGPDRTVIIGEPVGDNLEFWAEGDLVELPRSGTPLLYAKERHNYLTGCPEPDCHVAIREDPIRIDTLEPDIKVSPTYQDFAEHRDPLLEAAYAAIDSLRDLPIRASERKDTSPGRSSRP